MAQTSSDRLPGIVTGMDAPTLARCRDPYFSTPDDGTRRGLGLSVVDGFVRASGGIDYARRKMDDYLAEARASLAGFGESPFRDSFDQLLTYVTTRRK